MIISEKQIMILMAMTDTLSTFINDYCPNSPPHSRISEKCTELLDEIINQQSEELKVIE